MNAGTSPAPGLDMDDLCRELAEALGHIENLRHTHPYEAAGHASPAPHAPVPIPTVPAVRYEDAGKTNANTNANLASETPASSPQAREMAV